MVLRLPLFHQTFCHLTLYTLCSNLLEPQLFPEHIITLPVQCAGPSIWNACSMASFLPKMPLLVMDQLQGHSKTPSLTHTSPLLPPHPDMSSSYSHHSAPNLSPPAGWAVCDPQHGASQKLLGEEGRAALH